MTEEPAQFAEFFRVAFNHKPFDYQRRLALDEDLYTLVNVPTGAGKTASILGAWLWRRLNTRTSVGRRLVYCLPMRTLVEQTKHVAQTALARLTEHGLVAKEQFAVHVLMGGDVSDAWDISPESECILIGTQDMLLSRALNRGYAMSRFRWPVHFGLLNNDCIWVIDEVQLMGSGLATTLQLQALRRKLGVFNGARTIWMSATVEPEWLQTIDFKIAYEAPGVLSLDAEKDINASQDLKNRWEANKPIQKVTSKVGDDQKLSEAILEAHKQLPPHSRTLVVVNTVKRACALHETLKASQSKAELLLVHSRFRMVDRKKIIERLLAEPGPPGVIIVSTQVVEAGVDISSKVLFTELAPWPSLVQRFGRCNRRGEDNADAAVYWIDVPTSGKQSLAPPYDEADLNQARTMLKSLDPKDVGPKALHDNLGRAGVNRSDLFYYEHTHVIRQHDLHGLFATEADLAGGFTDISHFVRNREREADVQIYWRAFKGEPERYMPSPYRDELCMVRFFELAHFLGKRGFAWEWNHEVGKWAKRYAWEIRPGMTLLLALAQGGYDERLGWTGDVHHKPTPYEPFTQPQEFLDDDLPSQTDWWSLPDHLRDTQAEAQELVSALGLSQGAEGKAIVLAAWWHDTGKAHVRWQQAVRTYTAQLQQKAEAYMQQPLSAQEMAFVQDFMSRASQLPLDLSPWAKLPDMRRALLGADLPDKAKRDIRKALDVPFRPNMRHEAASALAAWREWQQGIEGWTALAVYLVACHHGKVRTVLRSTDTGKDVFGVHEGDALPALREWLAAEQPLDLRPKMIGATGTWEAGSFTVLTPSWIGMIAELLGPELPDDPDAMSVVSESEPRRLGPFRLAFLEALIRAADVKASRCPGKGKQV